MNIIWRIWKLLKEGDDPKYPVNGKLARIEDELRYLNGMMKERKIDERDRRAGSL